MIDKIEKLINSSCKEDILLAFHLVKHNTGFTIPVVIFWWIKRNLPLQPWDIVKYHDYFRFRDYKRDLYIEIYHSELE